ncbi:MAG: type II toxin-antitoxin system prevent-host-death family antitoxin [Lachnospiraceae bacterium]|nr:type II toxin-antitoxin system prevent-host-death family antitoxin [Solobacterium sp.]MBR3343993.1 type II toxin-antitoxin system prevent-host-death family antitoxin [Solobacterium sp.]MBR6155715.1 type II toxin-antitoxin system prevent-host-death family antitoxin [Lachnospiraceae bacterium]
MTEVNVTEFRRDLKKYAEMVKTQDLVIVSNGRPIMKITDPAKNKTLRMKQLRGIAKTDKDPEDILKERLSEL